MACPDIAVARFLITETLDAPPAQTIPPRVRRLVGASWRASRQLGFGAVAVAAALWCCHSRHRIPRASSHTVFAYAPAAQQLLLQGYRDIALDGSFVVYRCGATVP